MKENFTARIENWGMICDPVEKYTAPEQIKWRLHGNIRGHYRIGDKDSQSTSSLMGKTDDGRVVTKNTVYELGDPSAEYEKQFPGSKDRLLNTLPVIP